MIKKRFREYFTYTKKERNGIVVLLLILIILIILRVYQKNRSYGEIVLMDETYQKEIEEFESSLRLKKKKNWKGDRINKKETIEYNTWKKPEKYFNFDPNKISRNELEILGFSKKQISTLINYRESGGLFFEKKDLLKIYGLNEEQYKLLEPYIAIQSRETSPLNKENESQTESKIEIIDLNVATADDLKKLKGIGETYANRIIKFRDILGGYYTEEQLLEVYGLDSARFLPIKEYVKADTFNIKKISLNSSDYKGFITHPYLNKYQTESILKFRELMGNFTQIEQIYLNKLLTKEEYLKLKPYLKLN